MADFSVNSTNLSAPQGQGANVVAPVVEMQTGGGLGILPAIGEMFVKGIAGLQKQEAIDRKTAVVGSYSKELAKVNDALSSGQKDSAWAGAQTRAITSKYLASNAEYTTELIEAHKGFTGGTEIGEAQKQQEAQTALRNADMAGASSAGFTFYPGMDVKSQNLTIDAYKTKLRVEDQLKKDRADAAEQRAQAAEGRASESHAISINDHITKKNAAEGLLSIANANFDAFNAMGSDIIGKANMSFEQKSAIIDSNVNRIKMGLAAVSKDNPELAGPFRDLFGNMESTLKKIIDPKVKSASEAEILKNEWDSLMYKSKLLAVSDPAVKKAVVATDLFKDPALLSLNNTPAVVGFFAHAGLAPEDQKSVPETIVGTANEKAALDTFQSALRKLNTGSTANTPKAQMEAVNSANEIMRQTSKTDGSIPASALKNLSSFYSSAEFGKLAKEGKIDMNTAQNVKKVFEVQYTPAVQVAIMNKLDMTIPQDISGGGGKLLDAVDIKFSGSGVKFETAPESRSALSKFAGLGGESDFTRGEGKRALDDATKGLNQLIQMGAHLEGTTDYGKYWEANKHYILPKVFPDPAKLKVGDIIDGKKYLGGAYSVKRNWQSVQ